jgi:hypothetical protein
VFAVDKFNASISTDRRFCPVDMAWFTSLMQVGSNYITARLTGKPNTLYTNLTNAEQDTGGTASKWDDTTNYWYQAVKGGNMINLLLDLKELKVSLM